LKRDLPASVKDVVSVAAILMSLFHLYTAWVGPFEALQQRAVHLGFVFFLAFLIYKPWPKAPSWTLIMDAAIAMAGLVCSGYLVWNHEAIIVREQFLTPLTPAQIVLGILTLLLVLELTRRSTGWPLALVGVVVILYSFLCPYFPGILHHRAVPWDKFLDQMYLILNGVWGIAIGVSATYIILFVLFGAFLEQSGAGDLLMNLSSSLTGKSKGGSAKIAVVASSLFGTVSGNAAANVMSTGTFTIPMMVKANFTRNFASAVEAVASTGGQLMPPIMGASAFVMAELSGVSYVQIIKHAVLPSLMYYLALFLTIDFEARRQNLKGIDTVESPPLKDTLIGKGHLLLPVVVLVAVLVKGYTAVFSALCGTLSIVVISWFRRATRLDIKKILQALRNGAINIIPVAAACATAGIVLGVLNLTALGLKFTSLIISLAGSNLLIALLLTMMAGIILGMGLPTTPAYIIQAALLVPALIELGVQPIAAHFFVLYFACLSSITPPVSLAVYAAVAIGHGNLWRTGMHAIRLGLVGFIVPFVFVFSPALLMIGSGMKILQVLLTTVFAVCAIAGGVAGWMKRPLVWYERLLLVVSGGFLIVPEIISDLIGIGLLSVGILLVWKNKRGILQI